MLGVISSRRACWASRIVGSGRSSKCWLSRVSEWGYYLAFERTSRLTRVVCRTFVIRGKSLMPESRIEIEESTS